MNSPVFFLSLKKTFLKQRHNLAVYVKNVVNLFIFWHGGKKLCNILLLLLLFLLYLYNK